ncbi:uncharacterized protein LOC111638430 [Centruroides sculpturatus]|uniref:uncharacterized protein LOC111638430 n=1 Tax=Centruroides sculpturatus TaxID=218467 RepID=UPI000C6CBE57|nr:uncharacterized protein LOC111638430 [Centruroides sculpturatus]
MNKFGCGIAIIVLTLRNAAQVNGLFENVDLIIKVNSLINEGLNSLINSGALSDIIGMNFTRCVIGLKNFLNPLENNDKEQKNVLGFLDLPTSLTTSAPATSFPLCNLLSTIVVLNKLCVTDKNKTFLDVINCTVIETRPAKLYILNLLSPVLSDFYECIDKSLQVAVLNILNCTNVEKFLTFLQNCSSPSPELFLSSTFANLNKFTNNFLNCFQILKLK